ncbi:MAG TPA: DUF4097 family beta strand repeat-containing protein [Bryobacteraceae bacterium]|jgi:DUF4097 and DUF4098 domain-containing protein YvlB|nr:DUF4097 family beta strand repeat-containing protein [Bryobacteraceae bacterium]
MRRSSIVAPLILIAIGALFLARNLYPELPVLDYIARYWPFVLIAWGALRLGEIVFWAASERPMPRFGVSPGEWVLVIFLCIFGSSLHAVRGFSSWWPRSRVMIGGLDMFGENYEFPLSGEKASGSAPRVVIENFRGNARISAGDANEVKVTGHRTIRSLDQSAADNANAQAPLELTGDANEIHIRNNQDRVSNGRVRLTADMEITVPKGASIEAHGIYGDFDINGVNGSVDIISDNAGVRLQDIGGDTRIDLRRSDVVRASNVKGPFELKGRGGDVDLQDMQGPVTINGAYSGVLEFRNLAKPLHFQGENTTLGVERLPGDVRMALGDMTGSNLVGPITLSTRSRDVQLSDFTNSVDINVDRGDITLRPGVLPLARIEAQTRSGNIDLALPPNAKFDLSATTSHGEVNNDFGAPLRNEEQGRGAALRGSNGGPTVTLHSDHGDVTVRKATAEEKPAKEDTKSLKKIEQ